MNRLRSAAVAVFLSAGLSACGAAGGPDLVVYDDQIKRELRAQVERCRAGEQPDGPLEEAVCAWAEEDRHSATAWPGGR